MTTRTRIGEIDVVEASIDRKSGGECAAWYVEFQRKPGTYPVYAEFQYEASPKYVTWTVDVTVISDDFASRYGGVQIGTYDRAQNAGKPDVEHRRIDARSFLRAAVEGRYPEFRFDDGFDVRVETVLLHEVVEAHECRNLRCPARSWPAADGNACPGCGATSTTTEHLAIGPKTVPHVSHKLATPETIALEVWDDGHYSGRRRGWHSYQKASR